MCKMNDLKKNSRYRNAQGKHWIEVRVKDAHRLFDQRDPAPFREKDLDENFVEYIYSSIREFSVATPIKIIIYIEEIEYPTVSQKAIREAIHSYFGYQIDLQTRNIKSYWKRAQLFLLIGLFILIICIISAQNISVQSTPNLFSVLREGLIIFGWISIWKPIEVILFDWYPPFEKLRYYKKLHLAEIDIHFAAMKKDDG